MSSKCIDVSQFNGKISWKDVKASGIDNAYIRVGGRFGKTGAIYKDTRALENLKGAIASGLKVGVYFFTQATTESEAIEEADWTINFIKDYKITLPVAIDTEIVEDMSTGGRHNLINRTQRTNVLIAFMNRVKSKGYAPMFYCNTPWLYNKLEGNRLTSYDFWLAQWTNNIKPNCNRIYSVWQYSEKGKVYGINGNVDLNIIYKDYGKKETPIYDKYSDDIKLKAMDTLLNKYGTGEERKKKLGSSYAKVQELINYVLKGLSG